MHNPVIKVNPCDPQPLLIQKAAEIISGGGVISFPTRCLYGLGADAFNIQAVKRIFQIKKRSLEKPILILVKNQAQIAHLVTNIPEPAERIMKNFWPGDMTLIFNAGSDVPGILTAGTGKIGIRMPSHPVALALCNALSTPITGTSANFSGEAGYSTLSDFHPEIITQLDLVIDAGALAGGVGSTVIDVTLNPPAVLREGAVPSKKILDFLKN